MIRWYQVKQPTTWALNQSVQTISLLLATITCRCSTIRTYSHYHRKDRRGAFCSFRIKSTKKKDKSPLLPISHSLLHHTLSVEPWFYDKAWSSCSPKICQLCDTTIVNPVCSWYGRIGWSCIFWEEKFFFANFAIVLCQKACSDLLDKLRIEFRSRLKRLMSNIWNV